MLRIAIPKGRLFNDVTSLLDDAEIGINNDKSRKYNFTVDDIDFSIKKVRAIPQLVALGNFDIGFCGLDLVKENNYDDVIPLLDLGFNKVTIVVAEQKLHEQNSSILDSLDRPIIIATEYEYLADQWALKNSLAHITIQTYGSTEGYIPKDADVIFDCVETGETLKDNNLVVIEEIMTSTTHMIANATSIKSKSSEILMLMSELEKHL